MPGSSVGFALTGERFGAVDAQKIGLVHVVCTVDALEDRVAAIVQAILSNAPTATALTKSRVAGPDLGDASFADLVAEHARARQSHEGQEGLASFIDKRRPYWDKTLGS